MEFCSGCIIRQRTAAAAHPRLQNAVGLTPPRSRDCAPAWRTASSGFPMRLHGAGDGAIDGGRSGFYPPAFRDSSRAVQRSQLKFHLRSALTPPRAATPTTTPCARASLPPSNASGCRNRGSGDNRLLPRPLKCRRASPSDARQTGARLLAESSVLHRCRRGMQSSTTLGLHLGRGGAHGLPPPARRTRLPNCMTPARKSARPRPIVLRAIPVARDTAATSPRAVHPSGHLDRRFHRGTQELRIAFQQCFDIHDRALILTLVMVCSLGKGLLTSDITRIPLAAGPQLILRNFPDTTPAGGASRIRPPIVPWCTPPPVRRCPLIDQNRIVPSVPQLARRSSLTAVTS
jgi:hypothetical protein